MTSQALDFTIIGAGFYGLSVAVHFAERNPGADVLVLESEDDAMQQASWINQARIHNGYHYPRSFRTAFRSQVNYPSFLQDYKESVFTQFDSHYSIARTNSKVSPKQFETFCRQVGARLFEPEPWVAKLVNPNLIARTYRVEEKAFNSDALRVVMLERAKARGVTISFDRRVVSVHPSNTSGWQLSLESRDGSQYSIKTRYVVNCTYAGIEQINGLSLPSSLSVKYEYAEMCLVELPENLKSLGLTVMDGPFFSCMPFPARRLHSLSHVRYTPHASWTGVNQSPSREHPFTWRGTNFSRMIRDASRFVPALQDATYVDSIRTVKAVPVASEHDDGRPILFHSHSAAGTALSVLGGKLDNIYDVFEKIDMLGKV